MLPDPSTFNIEHRCSIDRLSEHTAQSDATVRCQGSVTIGVSVHIDVSCINTVVCQTENCGCLGQKRSDFGKETDNPVDSTGPVNWRYPLEFSEQFLEFIIREPLFTADEFPPVQMICASCDPIVSVAPYILIVAVVPFWAPF